MPTRIRTQTQFYDPAKDGADDWVRRGQVRKTINKGERRRRKARIEKEAARIQRLKQKKKAQAKKKAGRVKATVAKKVKGIKKIPTKVKRTVKAARPTVKASRVPVPVRSPVRKKSSAKPSAKPSAKKPKPSAPSAVAGTLDAAAAEKHPELAGGKLVLNAHLAQVEPSQNMDKFYVLQVINVSNTIYCWQRWGRTGTAGQGKLDGPADLAAMKRIFEAKFKEKTGVSYTDATSGKASALVNKYEWLSLNVAAGRKETDGTWEYYMDNGVDGKANGWYPYTASGGAEVEELFKTYFVRGNETMGVRIVQSGHFSYKVDLTGHPEYTQSNCSTGKVRKIRRLGD